MNYTKVTDPADLAAFTLPDPDTGEPISVIAPDEELLLLDTGDYVAASCSAYRHEHMGGRTLIGVVRWLDHEGGAVLDALDRRVLVTMQHTASVGQLTRYGEGPLKRELLLMLLGEPPTLIEGEPIIIWPDDVRASVSIRNAITAATNEGPAYDLADLL